MERPSLRESSKARHGHTLQSVKERGPRRGTVDRSARTRSRPHRHGHWTRTLGPLRQQPRTRLTYPKETQNPTEGPPPLRRETTSRARTHNGRHSPTHGIKNHHGEGRQRRNVPQSHRSNRQTLPTRRRRGQERHPGTAQ